MKPNERAYITGWRLDMLELANSDWKATIVTLFEVLNCKLKFIIKIENYKSAKTDLRKNKNLLKSKHSITKTENLKDHIWK